MTLLIAVSSALLLTCFLPQRSSGDGNIPPWVGRLPEQFHFLSSLLGLDNIVGAGWFAFLVGLFSCSLIFSTLAQYKTAMSQARRLPSGSIPDESIRLKLSPSLLAQRLQTAGYRLAGSGEGVERYVKNRWGYWGNFLIHLGLVTVVLFSLVYIVTRHRVLLRLTGGEMTLLTPGNFVEMKGVMPLQRRLPAGISLIRLEPRFWKNDKLEFLSSELSFTDRPGSQPRRVDVALCDKSQYGPFIVYQMNAYGRAFDLLFESPRGERHGQRFFLPYPPSHMKAGYGDTALEGTDLLLKGKFYTDSKRQSMKLNSPPLYLRLQRGQELLGEVTLQPGAAKVLGPLKVTLTRSSWWTDILLEGSRGTTGIFAGFAVILAGVLISYCLVPREIIVRESGGTLHLQQVARRFALFYREEFADIIQARQSGES